MILRLRAGAALVFCCALAGCGGAQREPTQVIVVIDAEPGVRAQAAKLTIRVRGTSQGAGPEQQTTLPSDTSPLLLPFVLALAPKDGDASRGFEVVATMRRADDSLVAQARALGSYVPNRKVVMWLMLEDGCIGRECGEAQTCSAGSCRSAEVDPATYRPLDDVELPTAVAVGTPHPAGDGGAGDGGASGASGGAGASGAGGVSGASASGAGGVGGASGAGGTGGQCSDGAQRACGTNVGECSAGVEICTDGAWGPCTGAQYGSSETCDAQDDDCDGDVDEDAPCSAQLFPHTSSAACVDGTCVPSQCEPLWADCNDVPSDGCERPLTTLDDCGGCGVPCAIANASETCETGSCRVVSCDPGWADCDLDGRSCETPLDTVDDCGACRAACVRQNAETECVLSDGIASCELIACTSARYEDCDLVEDTGCEVDLYTDAQHCGSCDHDCAAHDHVQASACVEGQCVFDCEAGYIDCDGVPDTGCEHEVASSLCTRCFEGNTTNFDAAAYTYSAEVDFDCGGTHTFDSATQSWDTDCCGTCPEPTGPVAQTEPGGPQVVILRASALRVGSESTLRLVGPYPVIFAVLGDATIAGTIDASANGATPGAGGNTSCGGSAGANGTGDSATGGGGGGGGGFGTAGGPGGRGGFTATGGGGGTPRGATALSPLLGGCGGGRGGGCTVADQSTGAGGGAFQLSVAGTLQVTGALLADGGNGFPGCGEGDPEDQEGGGSGGGSGGAILLEASVLDTASATLRARGGNGGMGANGPAGGPGATSSSSDGTGGGNSFNGGSGGGGGYGRVRLRDCLAP